MRRLALSMALVLMLAGCGGVDGGAPTSTGPAGPSTTTPQGGDAVTTTTLATTTLPPVDSTVPAPSTTPPSTSTTTTASEVTTTTWAGEPAGDPMPAAGSLLGVVGVAHDDELNVRRGPGIDHPVVGRLAPDEEAVVASGRAWLVDGRVWWEVSKGGISGWASSRYLAHLGSVDDLTWLVVERLGGRYPEAETMLDLGLEVARALASDEPPSTIVMSVAPTVGDLGEVTYDLVGVGDDSLAGWRLHVFGRPSESGEGFVLHTVEATDLCSRGVDPSGRCT